MREFLKQFLLYSRSERRAVVALVVLIAVVLLIPRAYRFYVVRPIVTMSDSSIANLYSQTSDTAAIDTSGKSLFYFDPNTIGIDDWKKLGLSDNQAGVIEKYKSKGGRFHTPDDLRKIYVLSDEMQGRLIPYVRIETKDNRKNVSRSYTIEINSADSAAWEALYGIGPALSSRIIRFRKALGGFYSIEQVRETYGLRDSTFLAIRPHLSVKAALVSKININIADYEALRRHPYIHARIAKAIIAYRNTNGKFENIEQVRGLKPVTDSAYKKVRPYLKVRE